MRASANPGELFNQPVSCIDILECYNGIINKFHYATNVPFTPLSQSVKSAIDHLISTSGWHKDKTTEDYDDTVIPYSRYIVTDIALKLFKQERNKELLLHLYDPSPFPPPEKHAALRSQNVLSDTLNLTGVARVAIKDFNPAVFKQLVVVLQQGGALTEEGEALLNESASTLPNAANPHRIAPQLVLLNFFSSLVSLDIDIAPAQIIKQIFWAGFCQLVPQAKWLTELYEATNPLNWIVAKESDIHQILRKAKSDQQRLYQQQYELAKEIKPAINSSMSSAQAPDTQVPDLPTPTSVILNTSPIFLGGVQAASPMTRYTETWSHPSTPAQRPRRRIKSVPVMKHPGEQTKRVTLKKPTMSSIIRRGLWSLFPNRSGKQYGCVVKSMKIQTRFNMSNLISHQRTLIPKVVGSIMVRQNAQ